jgi:hypothetical protein
MRSGFKRGKSCRFCLGLRFSRTERPEPSGRNRQCRTAEKVAAIELEIFSH